MSFSDSELMEYLMVFFKNNDMLPPVNTINIRFSVNSYITHKRLKNLEAKGFLQKNSINQYMFYRGE